MLGVVSSARLGVGSFFPATQDYGYLRDFKAAQAFQSGHVYRMGRYIVDFASLFIDKVVMVFDASVVNHDTRAEDPFSDKSAPCENVKRVVNRCPRHCPVRPSHGGEDFVGGEMAAMLKNRLRHRDPLGSGLNAILAKYVDNGGEFHGKTSGSIRP